VGVRYDRSIELPKLDVTGSIPIARSKLNKINLLLLRTPRRDFLATDQRCKTNFSYACLF
jgi:hypothetical protein